jgi:hypothetical protein
MTKERRKWPRVPAEHLVSFTVFGQQGEPEEKGTARTLDLGGGGAALEMTHHVEVGCRLEIKMVTGGHIVTASGRVAYNRYLSAGRWRVGVSFTEIGERDATIIAQEVENGRAGKE